MCDPSHKGQMGFMAGGGSRALPKSRYESISSYICNCKGGGDPTASTNRCVLYFCLRWVMGCMQGLRVMAQGWVSSSIFEKPVRSQSGAKHARS